MFKTKLKIVFSIKTYFIIFLFCCSCGGYSSVNTNNLKNSVKCSRYIVDSSNNSVEELEFTNKLKQALKEKLSVSDGSGEKQNNMCKLYFKYKIISHNSNISNSGDVSAVNERIILFFNVKDINNNLIFKDKILEFLSIQSSNYKYVEMTNKHKIYETKIESIANKVLMSVKRNLI